MEQSARLFAREALARLGRNLDNDIVPIHIQHLGNSTGNRAEARVFACGPGETSLLDGASDALLGVLGEATADPQQLPGGER